MVLGVIHVCWLSALFLSCAFAYEFCCVTIVFKNYALCLFRFQIMFVIDIFISFYLIALLYANT